VVEEVTEDEVDMMLEEDPELASSSFAEIPPIPTTVPPALASCSIM